MKRAAMTINRDHYRYLRGAEQYGRACLSAIRSALGPRPNRYDVDEAVRFARTAWRYALRSAAMDRR